ncbi:MAG TPA: heme ABC exporter ATP-binding protein CcmA [Candidatus Acidoferrales bacterium]|nr:heme ABC exporter ATP-binding protein CcmA [Candidatus Acidoferrales bacterium]
MSALRARGLTQRFGSKRVLGPIDIEMEAGERLALLGDNGAGKTTLLRVLATLSRPAAGELQLFGVDALARRERVRPRIGYLGHRSGLYPHLSARQNLEFFATLYDLEPARARSALAEVGLEDVADRPLSELSRGMEQRLGLARSLLHDPELVILDEPDASLDSGGRELLDRLLGGRTAVVASHDRALAQSLCGRALNLRAGRASSDPALEMLG